MTQEVLKLALEALERSVATCFDQYAHQQVMSQPDHFINQAITAIKEAMRENAMREVQRLGQEIEQEPVAWMHIQGRHKEPSHWPLDDGEISRGWEQYPLYTTPPQRTWVGLTDEEYIHITDSVYHQGHGLVAYYKAIEAKLKDKNNAA
jgi:hypothetical protein